MLISCGNYVTCLQALERCQLKDVVASKAEKLDALGSPFVCFSCIFCWLKLHLPLRLNHLIMFSEVVSEEVLASC